MALKYGGLLIHVTHIDPTWLPGKETEEPFDLAAAQDLLPLMASHGMNTLIVDVEDGVQYKSHPEMTRHYSVPIEQMRTLAEGARGFGIDVIPKLNFSKSGQHLHDMWMRPHWEHVHWLKRMDEYYAAARDVIAELTEIMQPARFFHIGMDEDHSRSVAQYVDAMETLRALVVQQGLRPVVWNDSCHFAVTKAAQVHAEKCAAAEQHISKDIVHVLWDYGEAHPNVVKRVHDRGFEVWAAPGRSAEIVAAWRKAIEQNGGSGLIMTRWIKCSERNRDALTGLLQTVGSGYRPTDTA